MHNYLAVGLFTASACTALALTMWLVWRWLLRSYPGLARSFLSLSVVLLVLKICYVALFVLLRPEQVIPPDGHRYMFEIQHIATAPWEWNPILGRGPNYRATPKMGMSYVYGLLLFLHGAPASLYTVLVINVVMSYMTCAVVFLLTLRLSSTAIPALTAMFLAGVYPETLFWNARVVRENMILLLVTLLAYVAIRLLESRQLIYVGGLLALTGLLLITRAQLALFLPLILVYYAGAVLVNAGDRRTIRLVPTIGLLTWLVLAGFGLIAQQIRAAAGARYLRLPGAGQLWDMFAANIASVLSLGARQAHGSLGVMLVPFTVAMFVLFIATLLRFRRIFAGKTVSAGLLVFIIVFFIASLATMRLPNIRFRSTVTPLALSLVSVACYYYWHALGLPRIARSRVQRGQSRSPATTFGAGGSRRMEPIEAAGPEASRLVKTDSSSLV